MSQSSHIHDYDDDLQLSKKIPKFAIVHSQMQKRERNVENRLQWIEIALS